MGGIPNTEQMPIVLTGHRPQVPLSYALVIGFGSAAAVWTAWFVTHLPWLGLSEQVRVAIVLATWAAAAVVVGRGCSIKVTLTGGLVSALLGLLVLGSKIKPQDAEGAPSAVLVAAAFLGLGAAVGLVGGVIGRGLPRSKRVDGLYHFALAAAGTIAPLLFIGGLVTSTNSGMAVPDWPRTYGSNMFLYPLAGAGVNIFLEHSHRLFGVLAGLAIAVLMIWTLVSERRGWVKTLAVIAAALIIVQAVLGGARVLENKRLLAMIHGILAQVTFGTVVSLAAVLSPTFKNVQRTEPIANPKRLRVFATGALHATLLQLIFGAMYRQFRDGHSLFTHAGFSMVVVVMMVAAGFSARAVAGEHGGLGAILRRCGRECLIVVIIQFALGWLAFAVGGRAHDPESTVQALIRTIHQANGAAVLATAIVTFIWAKRLIRISSVS